MCYGTFLHSSKSVFIAKPSAASPSCPGVALEALFSSCVHFYCLSLLKKKKL
jgi:hypothetical protein